MGYRTDRNTAEMVEKAGAMVVMKAGAMVVMVVLVAARVVLPVMVAGMGTER